jgi:selenocysteine-specific elongation factor
LVRAITPKRIDGIFRVPLERAFSVQGYGTVVAGIPASGMARVGDEVVLLPQNYTGRIRRIEVYGQDSDAVMAGQCAAINVGHWDHREIRRGDTLTVPGYFSPQEWFVGSLKLLPHEKLRLKSGAEVKFHTGTSEVAAMFYPLRGSFMEGGTEGLMQVRTKNPIVAGPGDHFLLRTPSPVRTIGGGRIVEAVDRRLKGSRPHVSEDLQIRADAVADETSFVEYCVRTAETFAVNESALAVRVKVLPDRLRKILADLMARKKISAIAGRLYIHDATAAEIAEKTLALIAAFHRQSPESPGLPLDQLWQSMSIDKPVFDAVISRLKEESWIIERSQRLALPSHCSTFQDEDAKLLDAIESLYREKMFSPPSLEEVVLRTNAARNKVEKLLRILCEHERLARVEDGLLFHRDAIAKARELLMSHFHEKERLESVEFKYLLDTTRKFALPFLDYLDRIGVTRRVGNTRYPKKLLADPCRSSETHNP